MARSDYEIKKILEQGTNIAVSAQDFDGFTLKKFAEKAYESGAILTINDSDEIDGYYIRKIAEEGKGNVVLR